LSAETKAALDAAIEAHLRDESEGDGAMVTAYVLYAAYLNTEIEAGLSAYKCVIPDGQPYHSTLGLGHSMIDDLVARPTVNLDD
jgi:hypothetical protein